MNNKREHVMSQNKNSENIESELFELNDFLSKTNTKRKFTAVFFGLSFFIFIASLSLPLQMICYPIISSRSLTTFLCVGCFGLFMNYAVSYEIVSQARSKLLRKQANHNVT